MPQPSPDRAHAARRTFEALTAGVETFTTFFEQVRVGLALADLSGRYVRVNQAYALLLGRRPEELVGVELAEVLRARDRHGEDVRRSATLLLEGAEQALTAEERYVTSDGTELWVLHGVTVVRDDRGAPVWFAVSAQDITERRRAEDGLRRLSATLAEQATRDPLTGLANRARLRERLDAALARDRVSGGSTALLFLDLDGFKAVNDRYGHAVGDGVLTAVAGRLSAGVRPTDTVARLGGDEFVVLVEATDDPAALDALVARLEASVAQPVTAQGREVSVGVSTGTAVARGGDKDARALLAEADAAMYARKSRRRAG